MSLVTAILTDPNPATVRAFAQSGLVRSFVVVAPEDQPDMAELAGLPCRVVRAADPGAGTVVDEIFARADTDWVLQVVGSFEPHPNALVRLVTAGTELGASLLYADYVDSNPKDPNAPLAHPLADWQRGSLEDAFPFGPIRLWSVPVARQAIAEAGSPRGLHFHGWYDLRLKVSERAPIVRLPEPLGVLEPTDRRASGQRVFDYLTAGRDRQIEAEAVCTGHLARIGALLEGPFLPYVPSGEYPVEASVVIPVKNRAKTVIDAVSSALAQQTDFPFNVIVVDNHSTDGTTELLAARAHEDPRLVHVRPERVDLGIGGCWNVAVQHEQAGKYVVQLDSDDLYQGGDVLQRMVDLLRAEQCGLAVGSYTLVNMKLEPIPPGLIDHREWTDENGANNALRIGGLGAPRAYATELLRRHPFPNASYGEDYAAVLRVCRTYKVGRLYESVYLCRRWEENSDADLNHLTKARFQTFKDRVRTQELEARIRRS